MNDERRTMNGKRRGGRDERNGLVGTGEERATGPWIVRPGRQGLDVIPGV
jgi:hypothetical protein